MMRVSKRLFAGVCPAALLALSITPSLAQSTGSEQVETVVVTGTRVVSTGLGSFASVAKQSSSIDQTFIETQTSGQTFFQNLNMLPGFNFTSTDGYGTSGGNIRMHGQDGAHISVTLDGMPLNDTGNYAMYTNQMVDPEITSKVTLNQGTTDVDSPTAAVTGGTIAARSVRPADEFGVRGVLSIGTQAYQRYFGMVDTGEFGPWDTKAFAAFSYSQYDKFTGGAGELSKRQFNAGVFQDMGSLGWMNLGVHFNRNRNAFYRNSSYTGLGINQANWNYDYDNTCTPVAAVAGTAQAADSCSNFYNYRLNPSDTGNIRFSSLWNLADGLVLTADTSLQFVLANGGGTSTLKEHSGQTISAGAYSSTTSTATTAAYGCITGSTGGCDLNGDGDIRDTVRIYSPSNTNTRRWGFNTSLIYQPWGDDHTIRAAYTLDYGVHRQTGSYSFLDHGVGPYDVFGGWKSDGGQIYSADGTALQKRDRNSRAILNQLSADYEGDYFDGIVHTSIGFRLPFFQRDLDNYCYTQVGSYNVMCTKETPTGTDTAGRVSFASTSTKYVAPLAATKKWNKFLPHIGVSVKPFGEQHQFYANFTKELAAPRTDYLYSSTGSIYTGGVITQYTAYEDVKPEYSDSYIIGYRFMTDDFNASIALWNQQVRNRILSSWDEDQSIYTERNVDGVNYAGVDFDAFYRVTDGLWVYGSATYTGARQIADAPLDATHTAFTGGKQLSEVPNWMLTGRVQYELTNWLKLGILGKYVGRRFATDDNNVRVPDYFTSNVDLTVGLDEIGMKGSDLRFNVDNVFNRHYYGSISSQYCYVSGYTGCTTSPYVTPAALRTFSVTLSAKY